LKPTTIAQHKIQQALLLLPLEVTNDGLLTIDLTALAQSDDGQAAILGLADYWNKNGAIYSAEGLLLAAADGLGIRRSA
jgi:hypothetical protein